jgi:hypothetical protein
MGSPFTIFDEPLNGGFHVLEEIFPGDTELHSLDVPAELDREIVVGISTLK